MEKSHIATMLLVYCPGGNKCLKNCVYKSDVVSKVTLQQNALIYNRTLISSMDNSCV